MPNETKEKEVHFTESAFMPPLEPHRLNVITNSLKNVFLDCSMKYYWMYGRRLSPKVAPDYFVWGGFLHYAMEHTADGKDISEVQKELEDQCEKRASQLSLSPAILTQYEGFILLLPYVLDAYMLHYKNELGKYEIVETERQFSLALGNVDAEDKEGQGWTFEGKIDQISRDKTNGVMYVWDMKTPGSTGDKYFQRLPLDSQLKGYILAAQKALGHNILAAIYDVVQKPSQQKKSVDDPEIWASAVGRQYLLQHEKLFQRQVVVYTQHQIDDYYYELCMTAKQLAFHQQQGIWLKHHPGNRIGGCPYYNLCVNGENPITMSDFYERPVEHYNYELEDE